MIESFLIEANLRVKGDALKTMQQFAKQTALAAREQKNLLGALKNVNSQLSVMSKHLISVNPMLNKLSTSMGKLGAGIKTTNSSLNHFNEGLIGAEGNTQRLKYQADTLKNSLNSLSHAGKNAATSMVNVGKSSKIRNLSSSKASHGRSSSGFMHGFVGGTVSTAFGSPSLAAGLIGAELISGGYKQQSEFEQRQAQFLSQGFTKGDMSRINSFVSKNKIPGVSQKEMMNAVVMAAMATGSVDQAMSISPQLAKMSFANNTIFKKGMTEHQYSDLIRFAELRAGSDPNKLASQIDLAQRAIMATGGKMSGSQLLNFQQMATTAGYHLTDQGFLKLLPIMQEMGGFRAGTGYQTMFNRLITGKGLGTASGEEGQRIGLLRRGKTSSGMLEKQPTLKAEYASMLQTDLVGFVKDIYMPLLKKANITDPMAISKETAIVFDRTAARLIENIIKTLDKVDRMFPLHEKASDVQSSFLQATGMEKGQMKIMTQAWEDFHKAFGAISEPAVIKGMQSITGFLYMLTDALNNIHEGTVKAGTVGASVFNRGSGALNKATSLFSISSKEDAKPMVNVFLDGEKLQGALQRSIFKGFSTMQDQGATGNNSQYVPQSISLNTSGNSIS